MASRAPGPGGKAARLSGSLGWLASADAGWQQACLMAVVTALTAAFASVGLGSLGRLFFMFAAVASAAFYIRRSPWHYLTLTLWFWTLTAFARRLIDFHAGFDPVNLILATPNLITVFMLKDILTSRELLRQREAVAGLFMLLPVLYGLGVNFAQGDIVPGAVAAADWICPLFYYFYFLANWRRISEADVALRNFLSVNGLVMVSYGLYQFLAPPPWDVAWVLDSGLTSMGQPIPYGLHVFGTLNGSGALAIWLGTILLLSLHFRTRLSIPLIPAGAVVLLLTLSRSEVGAVVLGLVVAALVGRGDTRKVLGISLVAIGLVVAGIAAVDPDMTDVLATRFGTVGDLRDDDSASVRADIYAATPAVINANPLGLGIAATGRGAVAGQTGLVNVDSGPLAIYISLGWVGGSVYFVGIFLIIAQAMRVALKLRSSAALALGTTALSGVAILLFLNVTGFPEATLLLCAAYAAALGIAARRRSRMTPKAIPARPHASH